jgi:UDP-glucose 4-epimerase
MIGLFIGGSGSIGSGLIKQLVKKKKIKLIYNIDKTKLNFKHKKIKIVKKDLTKSFTLKKFKNEIDYAVILAFKINYNNVNAK